MASLTTTRLVPLFQGTPQVNPSWAFKQNAGCRGSWQTPLVKHADMAVTQPGLVHKVWEIDKSHSQNFFIIYSFYLLDGLTPGRPGRRIAILAFVLTLVRASASCAAEWTQ